MGDTLTQTITSAQGASVSQVQLPPLTNPALAQSMTYCREITRTCARNFYYGLKLLPEPKRSALCAIYAFMRACDDLADEYPSSPESTEQYQLDLIEQFRETTVKCLDSDTLPIAIGSRDMWPAFWYTVHQFPIKPAHLHAMLDGQRMDVLSKQYKTFDDLYQYCYNVASVVGLVCVSVWGIVYQSTVSDMQTVNKLAEHRGIALQLTNIIRDLQEDAQRGRVYLPDDELEQFGYNPSTFASEITNNRTDKRFDKLIAMQIDRARQYYQLSEQLERHIDPQCRPTSWAMSRIYRNLLEKIACHPRRILSRRVKLNPVQKMSIAMTAVWRGRSTRNESR